MKLSIIIPAYNAEAYIEHCLNSCLNQDISKENLEMIVVNDGSNDATESLVKHMSTKNPNIRQIMQKNSGNGAARNTGVKNAIGDYILFLDADDYLAHQSLGTLVKLVYEHQLDLLGFSSINVNDSDKIASKDKKQDVKMDEVKTGIDFIGTYNYKAEVWWYLIKKSFYMDSGVSFYDRKFVQDSYLTPTLFSKAERTAFVEFDVHRYRKSPNSITRKKTVEHLNRHFKDLSFSIQKLYELRKNLISQNISNKDALQRLHAKQQRYVFIVIVRFIKSGLPIDQLRSMLNSYRELEAYPMDKFMSIPDYKSLSYSVLTHVFNSEKLLYVLLYAYQKLTFK